MTTYLKARTMELPALALVCGKSKGITWSPMASPHLTVEAAAMARALLAGSGLVRGRRAQDSVRQSGPFMI